MPQSCILVRTTQPIQLSSHHTTKLALQLAQGRITRMGEKGPYKTFPYGSTQAPKMPRMARNLQFWTFARPNDGMTGLNRPHLANLYRTSLMNLYAVLGTGPAGSMPNSK